MVDYLGTHAPGAGFCAGAVEEEREKEEYAGQEICPAHNTRHLKMTREGGALAQQKLWTMLHKGEGRDDIPSKAGCYHS